MKIIIYISFLMYLFLSLFVIDKLQAQQTPRNIIWAGGSSQTSIQWVGFRQEMTWKGYQFNSLLDNNYQNAVSIGVLGTASYLNNRIMHHQASNVLGIGHGFGGIALRYAQLQNSNIDAMILCGTPNQGAWAIQYSTFVSQDGKTATQLMVEKVEGLQAGNDCQDCGLLSIFKNWINSIESGKAYMGDLSPDSDIIKDINKAENLPTVPYIVLYGTVDNFSLIRMMDTRSSPGDSDHLTRCYNERILAAQKRVEADYAAAVIRSVGDFLASSLKYLGGLIDIDEETSAGTMINLLGNFITSYTQIVHRQIEADITKSEELAKLLRCQIANHILEAEWMLMQLNGQFVEEEIIIPYDVMACYEDCETQFPDANSIYHCYGWCQGQDDVSYYAKVFVREPTDGLLSESEQKLDGPLLVGDPIHLPNTNHFQETHRGKKVLTDEMESIFQGNMGAVFSVPKN